jgi:hypothetical protein
MEEKGEKYLPLGSICLLKGGKRYIVVIGYLGMGSEEKNTVYDYIGAVYPLGVITSDISFMFDHDQIEKVIFKGFEDEEGKEFNEKLNSLSKDDVLAQLQKTVEAQSPIKETTFTSNPTVSAQSPVQNPQPVSFENLQ